MISILQVANLSMLSILQAAKIGRIWSGTLRDSPPPFTIPFGFNITSFVISSKTTITSRICSTRSFGDRFEFCHVNRPAVSTYSTQSIFDLLEDMATNAPIRQYIDLLHDTCKNENLGIALSQSHSNLDPFISTLDFPDRESLLAQFYKAEEEVRLSIDYFWEWRIELKSIT